VIAGHSVLDVKSILLAKHAQHVVLVHFPIALFITGIAFDLIGHWTKRRYLLDAGYCNLLIAAVSTLPVLATGLLAWQLQLEGQRLKGILLAHLLLASVSTLLIWITWWVHHDARRRKAPLPMYGFAVEIVGALVVGLTAHLGGFLTGVNS
jgi:uncharacterized membrane protein